VDLLRRVMNDSSGGLFEFEVPMDLIQSLSSPLHDADVD
jgi:hypothetical protein